MTGLQDHDNPIILLSCLKYTRFVLLCGIIPVSHMRHLGLAIVAALLLCHAHAVANPLARTVTIYRDTYGVPHVFGRTDASTVFGFAYAQAEDNFWRVEENFISALGRASEFYGEKTLDEDRLNHALEIPRLAREEYARLDGQMRSMCDAFAAGFNYYLERHPGSYTATAHKNRAVVHARLHSLQLLPERLRA